MKLFKNLKKGFTLIELVVVIAVIAILSAVSVVSYVAITNKAKQSSDEQAVSQMNTILTANEVMDLKTINDVFDAFAENGLDAEDYKPLMKDRYFFWDEQANQIIYTDEKYEVLYPESLKGPRQEGHQWYSLTQALKKVELGSEVKNVTGGKGAKDYSYTVETPEQLFTVGQEIKSAMLEAKKSDIYGDYEILVGSSVTYLKGDFKLVLDHDIDLMGGAFNFCIDGNFEIVGNNHTIKGIVNNKDFVKGKSKTLDNLDQAEFYGTGLLGYIANGTATFSNVNFENCVFGFSQGKGAGLVGYASNSTLNFENVTIKNCNMEAYEHSAGGFVADTQGGVVINLKGNNSIANSNLKVYESLPEVTTKECYGAGYFIGRQCNENLVVNIDEGASFTQTNNTKTFGSSNKKIVPSSKTGLHYWDDEKLANRKLVTE